MERKKNEERQKKSIKFMNFINSCVKWEGGEFHWVNGGVQYGARHVITSSEGGGGEGNSGKNSQEAKKWDSSFACNNSWKWNGALNASF